MHAFIIEDDYLISQSLQDMLGDLGFERFSFARSEDAAIAGATQERFDLITVDIRLLPGDGVKAVQVICAGRDTPVIFITGRPDEARDRLRGRQPEAIVLGKPVRAEDLAAAVRTALAR